MRPPAANDSVANDSVADELVRCCGVAREAVRVVWAPYRICPLGAHIDHQLGHVTALALDRGVHFAYAPQLTPEVCVRSRQFPGEVRFTLDAVPDQQTGEWGNYLRGAVRALQQQRELTTGLVGLTDGSISEGGLSSSAAVGAAYLLALEDVNGLRVTPQENIRLAQFIENSYLGLRSGILDQSAILLSRRQNLLWLDCATLEHALWPQPDNLAPFTILIACSGIQKALVGTAYNRRVAECQAAAETLLAACGRPVAGATGANSAGPRPPVLRDITADEYAAHGTRLSGPPARRAAHFFSEMDRVQRGLAAWRQGDLPAFGRLVTASGASSISNYECGAPPLVDLYQLLIAAEGVYGARFSGAGFRGCCLALVQPEAAQAVAAQVHAEYSRRHPDLAAQAKILLCQAGDGARRLDAAA